MLLKDILEYWKAILVFVVFIITTTVGLLAWADNEIQQAITLMKAEESLIHNDYYQNNRIARKEIEIKEHQRELDNLLEYIGDDTPNPRQAREIEYLDEEILRLRKEIEEIRVQLANAHNTQ